MFINRKKLTAYTWVKMLIGTTISNTLKFDSNTERLVSKARQKLLIMRKLCFTGTSDQLALISYDIISLYILWKQTITPLHTVIYRHQILSTKERTEINKITKLASNYPTANCLELTSSQPQVRLELTVGKSILTRDAHPVITFDTLPSGGVSSLTSDPHPN